MRLVHTNRHGLELSRRLFEPTTSTDIDDLADIGSEKVLPKKVYFDRKLAPVTVEKVSPLTLSLSLKIIDQVTDFW